VIAPIKPDKHQELHTNDCFNFVGIKSSKMIAQIVGYIAPALLAISLTVNNSLKFRWLNIAGCFAFMVYGFLIQAFPVVVANGILLCINIFQLSKLYSVKETFEMLEINSNNELVSKFLSFHQKDIFQFFPNFRFNPKENDFAFMVLRDLAIANIFIAHINKDGNAEVQINYTVPQYRDYKVGRFIFEREKEHLIEKGIHKIVYNQVMNQNHEHFIQVMGFQQQSIDGTKCYVNSLI